MTKQALINWINTHDCGVTPCAVLNSAGEIEIRVEAINTATRECFVETQVVTCFADARNALGY